MGMNCVLCECNRQWRQFEKKKEEKDIDIYEYIKCENHGIGCERMFSAILFCSRESEI